MMIIKKRELINRIIALLFVSMIVFSRGMILGNIALKISFVCALICIFFTISDIKLSRKKIILFCACAFFFSYCCFNGLLLNDSSRYKTVIEDVVYLFLSVIAALLVLRVDRIEKIIGAFLVYLLALFVISYMITFGLSIFIDLSRLKITTISYEYFYDSPVYFPFTIVYGVGQIGALDIFRMQGFGRECGITQTIYIWAYYRCERYVKRVMPYKMLMALGIIFCFSTTGILLFFLTLFIDFFSQNERYKNRFFVVILIAILVSVLAFGGTYSFANRIKVSYADRLDNIKLGWDLLLQHPLFGVGYVKDLGFGKNDLSDICLLSSSGKIGIVGVLLFVIAILAAFCCASNKKVFFLATFGFIITAIFAQPLFKVPLMYVMFFMNYDVENNHKKTINNTFSNLSDAGGCLEKNYYN